MGDLFFIIRMSIYTVFIVLFMQVKIGPQTVEDRVINFTHNSQFSSVVQETAQGAVTFIGAQYNRFVGHINTSFTRQHGSDQIPGKRLQNKLGQVKDSLRTRFSEGFGKAKSEAEDLKNQIEEGAKDAKTELRDSIEDSENI